MSKSMTSATPSILSYPEGYLPDSDGTPMAETDPHRKQMVYSLNALEERYFDVPDTYVSGNIFVYYRDKTGNLTSISPDIFVVHGVTKKDRRYYHVEEEGKAPDAVIELTSSDTRMNDLVTKRLIYAHMGVQEYFIYDPYSEALRPALRGFRLERGKFVPMTGARLRSEVLEMDLVLEHGMLQLYLARTGERLRSYRELAAATREAENRARQVEAENAHLREELAKLMESKK